MSSHIRVLIRDYPHRSIALATDSHALVFHHTPAASTDRAPNGLFAGSGNVSQTAVSVAGVAGQPPRCMVEFSSLQSTDLSDYRSLSAQPVHGTLGLIAIHNDVFLCLVSAAASAATVRPGETVQKILAVAFYCLNCTDYDHVLYDEVNAYPSDTLDEEGFEQGHGRRDPILEHPCMSLKKLLSSGTFYYSADFDLTRRMQRRSCDGSTVALDSLDAGFLWNSHMIQPLVNFRSRLSQTERNDLDASGILTSAIRGFASTFKIPPASHSIHNTRANRFPSAITLISRLSCRRAGTRFNARGMDDDGNVANFVESETILWSPDGVCFSYVQVRGSVPLFWEQQPGLLPGQQKVSLTRPQEATQPAFDKHMESLELCYGAVHVVNLLSATKPSEAEISERYRHHIGQCSLADGLGNNGQAKGHGLLKLTEFDFHAETRGPAGYQAASMITRYIADSTEGFAHYLSEEVEQYPKTSQGEDQMYREPTPVLQQEGVFRTNCLDCLDRTNLVQTIISRMAVEMLLHGRGELVSTDFWNRHSTLWADNGDALSKIYAGTGALKSSFTRSGKMSFAGAIADARKSAQRIYINNFVDKGRQNTIDMLLGRLMGQAPVHLFDPINDFVASELSRRASEFSSEKSIHIWAGTFNLNGKTEGITSDLSQWLTPPVEPSQRFPEIVAVGFQEIVELSPQQIMSTDPVRRQQWEAAVKKTLNDHAQRHGQEEYVSIRGGQLVGASLSIFVRASVLKDIKNVEGSLKKTGMSGIAGNKGAVAIRMEYASTSICFVTAHLAAGFANYDERNRDYKTINHGLRFQRNRTVEDHDTVIWLGDFNYRIGLSNDKVRSLVDVGDLDTLYDNDQLNLQMMAGLTFPYYSEARITFPPTYKYDVGTEIYDTSEKARIPAWCDRILRKGTNLRQINYNAAPLTFSDHRPVYATFLCTVTMVDEKKREQLGKDLYQQRKGMAGDLVATSRPDDSDDEDLIGYDPIDPTLPPASSSRRKWWLDNGQPVQSVLQPPGKDHVVNSKRPSNPWTPSPEPDWVRVEPLEDNANSVDPHAKEARPTAHISRKPPPLPRRADTTIIDDRRQSDSLRRSLSNASSSVSSSHSVRRKNVPPVPNKPSALATRPTTTSLNAELTPPREPTIAGELSANVSVSSSSDAPSSVPIRQQSGTLGGLLDAGIDDVQQLKSWDVLRPNNELSR